MKQRVRPGHYEMYRASLLARRAAEKIEVEKLPEQICKLCGRPFKAKRLKQVFCGTKCPGLEKNHE